MKSVWLVCSCLAFGVGTGACSDDADDDVAEITAFCQGEASDGFVFCNEHLIPADATDSFEEGCMLGEGTVVDACPTEGLVGTCSGFQPSVVSRYYGVTLEHATDVCEGLGGTFTPAQ